MEDKVLKALNITPTVYVLRVTHIVLHTLFPVAGALILVAEKMMPLGIISYAVMTFSIFAIMVFLAFDFDKLPRTIYGMTLVLVSPIVAFLVYKFAFGMSIKLSFIWTVVQELLYVVFLGFGFLREKEPSLKAFIMVTTFAGVYAIFVFGWYLWYGGEFRIGDELWQQVAQILMFIFLIGGALYQAYMSYLRNRPSI